MRYELRVPNAVRGWNSEQGETHAAPAFLEGTVCSLSQPGSLGTRKPCTQKRATQRPGGAEGPGAPFLGVSSLGSPGADGWWSVIFQIPLLQAPPAPSQWAVVSAHSGPPGMGGLATRPHGLGLPQLQRPPPESPPLASVHRQPSRRGFAILLRLVLVVTAALRATSSSSCVDPKVT